MSKQTVADVKKFNDDFAKNNGVTVVGPFEIRSMFDRKDENKKDNASIRIAFKQAVETGKTDVLPETASAIIFLNNSKQLINVNCRTLAKELIKSGIDLDVLNRCDLKVTVVTYPKGTSYVMSDDKTIKEREQDITMQTGSYTVMLPENFLIKQRAMSKLSPDQLMQLFK